MTTFLEPIRYSLRIPQRGPATAQPGRELALYDSPCTSHGCASTREHSTLAPQWGIGTVPSWLLCLTCTSKDSKECEFMKDPYKLQCEFMKDTYKLQCEFVKDPYKLQCEFVKDPYKL
ncbi:UNVERIFIED_CONTAM: hypothetical protein FKN15_008008 [Acipenser sinensis]